MRSREDTLTSANTNRIDYDALLAEALRAIGRPATAYEIAEQIGRSDVDHGDIRETVMNSRGAYRVFDGRISLRYRGGLMDINDLTLRAAADIEGVNEVLDAMSDEALDAAKPWEDYDGEEIAANCGPSGDDVLVLLVSGEVAAWRNRERQWEEFEGEEIAALRTEARLHGDEDLVALLDLVVSDVFVVLGDGIDGLYPVDTAEQIAEVEALLAELGAESTPVYRGRPLVGEAVQGFKRIYAARD